MLDVSVTGNALKMGRFFSVRFQRTLRIPDDGRTYPLPPGLGEFPVKSVADFESRVPESWRGSPGVFIPMYQREAMWLAFDAASWRPNAVQITAGQINAVSGEVHRKGLSGEPQDYLVCPDQPWLDGFNCGEGVIKQFVAMPLGMGYTVEGQVTGEEKKGGIQIRCYEPREGMFPETAPIIDDRFLMDADYCCCMESTSAEYAEMGLAEGGSIKQKIYPDPYGVETWDVEKTEALDIHIVNSKMYAQITGEQAPASPICAETYTSHGLPWFDLYDEDKQDLNPSSVLSHLKSVEELDIEKGIAEPAGEKPLLVHKHQVKKLEIESLDA